MNMKKILAFVLCMVLVAGLSVGGTLAWITMKSETVVNTFTVGDITITLDEPKVDAEGKIITGDGAARVQANSYDLIPGGAYQKDPTLTVAGGSEACYLFVQFDKSEYATYLQFTSALDFTPWNKGDGTNIPANVYYTEVAESANDTVFHLITDNAISVSADLTKANMPEDNQTLSYKAFAVQKANVANAATAWGLIPDADKQ